MLTSVSSYLSGGNIETISQPHEVRARELHELGDDRAAKRVLLCGAPPWPGRRCKRRDCPSCSRDTARHHADQYAVAVAAMSCPTLALFTCPSQRLSDLDAAMARLRSAITILRRRSCFAGVVAGVGGIEPKLAEGGKRWALHAHVTLDVTGHLDVAAVAGKWRALTDGRGAFKLHPTPKVFAPDSLARYATKPADWSPAPGSLSLECFAWLRSALRGRRLLIRWPNKRNKRGSARLARAHARH